MNEALLEYIDHKLNDEELGRVFPITFQGDEYFVKRAVGNNRSSWIKPSRRCIPRGYGCSYFLCLW